MKTLFVISGPTAVGKTDVCIQVARHLGVPIINADSRQLYAEIPIGTAAPTAAQQAAVKHYFVGTHHLTDYYSASMYERDVLNLLQPPGELSNDSCWLISGGSMMYVDAVCHGIDDIPTIDSETRAVLKHRLATEGLDRLVEELHVLDPSYYEIVDRKNTRRVVHALEICYMTGRTYTSYRNNIKKPRPFHIVKIGLQRDREELYTRINRRVLQMLDEGFEDEVRRVYAFKEENSLNTVGYKEMFEYLDGLCTLDNAVERIQSATRRYSRKQMTWLKRDPMIHWFHPDDVPMILSFIDQMKKESEGPLQQSTTNQENA